MMKLLTKDELVEHDVYEFCYAKNYFKFWNEDSIYLSDDDFQILVPFLNQVFSMYHYYGPQKISLLEWGRVKEIALNEKNKNQILTNFFDEIDEWIKKDNSNVNYFWIYGV